MIGEGGGRVMRMRMDRMHACMHEFVVVVGLESGEEDIPPPRLV